MLSDVIPRPIRAFTGSALIVGGSGLVGVPFGAILGVPLLVVGNVLCAQSTFLPPDDDLSKVRSVVAEVFFTLGAIALCLGCIMTSFIAVEYLVELKRGRSLPITWDSWATLFSWFVVPVLLTLGNFIRARSSIIGTAVRAIYWFLHFPAVAAIVMVYAALGLTLTA
jgi:hypothetical protein